MMETSELLVLVPLWIIAISIAASLIVRRPRRRVESDEEAHIKSLKKSIAMQAEYIGELHSQQIAMVENQSSFALEVIKTEQDMLQIVVDSIQKETDDHDSDDGSVSTLSGERQMSYVQRLYGLETAVSDLGTAVSDLEGFVHDDEESKASKTVVPEPADAEPSNDD